MPDTTDPPEGINPDTQLVRFKRDIVFKRASEKGAETHDQRMELMDLSRATYFRLLRGTNIRLDTARKLARNLDLTVEQAIEPVTEAA